MRMEKAAGAVLLNMETQEILIARAKTVIIATGGAGRLHYQGFPTSNHYGATADGLVLAYRVGAPLLYIYAAIPSDRAAFPAQIFGRSSQRRSVPWGDAHQCRRRGIYASSGDAHVAAASIIRECQDRGKGIPTPDGVGIWLDTPMIEAIHGKGAIEKRIPAMLRMFLKYGYDREKTDPGLSDAPLPERRDQNRSANGMSEVENLFVAGEAVGGIHGKTD